MKKHLLSSLAFLAILGLLIGAASFLFYPKSISAEAGLRFFTAYGYASEPENSLDAVIIGDSLPLYGVNPLVIFQNQGIACYDCATPQQNLAVSRRFLSDILRYQQPKLVMLEANVLYRPISQLEPLTEQISHRIPVLAYHDNWKILSLAELFQPIRWDRPVSGKGHFSTTQVEPAVSADYMDRYDPEKQIPEENLVQLRRFLQTCQSSGCQLLLISVPDASAWSYQCHDAVAQIAQELGVGYLDMNLENTGIDWASDCLDKGDHLNEAGAQKASVFLGQYLAETGLFSDKRTDSAYSSWLKQ